MKTLNVETNDRIATVRLDRPSAHNAINPEMIREATEAFGALNRDAAVRAVVLTGTGPSFCAGADVHWMREAAPRADAAALARMFRALHELDKPLVAAVNGAALGGGMGFVAVADVVLASDRAVFGLPEVRLGLVPAIVSVHLFRKAPPGLLREYFLTGGRFAPERAVQIGLVNAVIPHDDLMRAAMEKARVFLQCGPAALAACKGLFRTMPGLDPEAAAVDLFTALRTSPEAQEGFRAFLEKRPPSW